MKRLSEKVERYLLNGRGIFWNEDPTIATPGYYKWTVVSKGSFRMKLEVSDEEILGIYLKYTHTTAECVRMMNKVNEYIEK